MRYVKSLSEIPLWLYKLNNQLFILLIKELTNINEWFVAIKNCLNVKKPGTLSFHKPRKKDNIPHGLPNLTISNHKIKQKESVKFIGSLPYENLPGKNSSVH